MSGSLAANVKLVSSANNPPSDTNSVLGIGRLYILKL